jgi:outer membrane protein assembly factor BamB
VRLLILMMMVGTAYADSTISSDTPALKCSFEDGPHWKKRATLMRDPRLKNIAPFSNFVHAGGKDLLFEHDGKSALVTAADMHVIWEWPHRLTALAVEGDRLRGEVRIERSKGGTTAISFYEPISYKRRWQVEGLHHGEDSAATLVDGDHLILATFHRIATGSQLVSVDIKTGTRRWTADVEQVNAAHSEYFNDVSLEKRGSTVVMRGFEASGCYAQVFDLATGKRLSSQMRRAW